MTTAIYSCECCGEPFTARIVDRDRGMARFCSKSCKGKHQGGRKSQDQAPRAAIHDFSFPPTSAGLWVKRGANK